MCRVGELQTVAQLVGALRQGNLGQLTLQLPSVGSLPVAMATPQTHASLSNAPTMSASDKCKKIKKNEIADARPYDSFASRYSESQPVVAATIPLETTAILQS